MEAMKKVRKHEEEEGGTYKDRLSNLPDNIIHHIFSFLDTQFAIQTSVLSKRWKNLWASSPYLHFGNQFGEHLQFKKFVRRVLSRRDNIPVSKLSLGEDAPGKTGSSIKRIITYAASHGLQHLTICSKYFQSFEILSHVGSIQSLKSMHLSGFDDVSLLSSFDLPMLTTLYLDNCYLSWVVKSTHCINVDPFASFINLKNLILTRLHCEDISNLKISGPQLENLTIRWMYGHGYLAGLKVEIVAPKLKSFSFRNTVPFGSSNLDLPLLEVADIDIVSQEKFEEFHLDLINMLRGLHHAQFLKLSFDNIEALMKVPGVLIEHQSSSPFSRLKTLKLQFYDNSVDIPANVMNFFIGGSTSLENISIEHATQHFGTNYKGVE